MAMVMEEVLPEVSDKPKFRMRRVPEGYMRFCKENDLVYLGILRGKPACTRKLLEYVRVRLQGGRLWFAPLSHDLTKDDRVHVFLSRTVFERLSQQD